MTVNDLIKLYLQKYRDIEIEASLISAFLDQNCLNRAAFEAEFPGILAVKCSEICERLQPSGDILTLKFIENVFEALIGEEEKRENGVVFTPNYIVEYIIDHTLNGHATSDSRIIDPACGSGSFLVLSAEHLSHSLKKPIELVVSENIFGIDVSEDNVRRTKELLYLLILSHCGDVSGIRFNIICADSLKTNWPNAFHTNSFDFILGNPPYVNTHDMAKETATYLKKHYATTQKGTYNIYYAFIEHSMEYLSSDGMLGFVLPNNYLTISSAEPLRVFLADHSYLSTIIDFGENMIFAPIRTYNSLLFLNKRNNHDLSYSTLNKSENIAASLEKAEFLSMPVAKLNSAGWMLLNHTERENIYRIENAGRPIKASIRVGIATLRDKIYLLDGYDIDRRMYFKSINGEKYYIESGITSEIYKISDIKTEEALLDAKKRIIFPYMESNAQLSFDTPKFTYSAIPEEMLKSVFPLCYQYLCACRSLLDARDKGKANAVAWYAYGRSQGLSYRCKKLLYPTFSLHPKFILENNSETLFCNGYAIIETSEFDLTLLQKILNSVVMDYYISLTSYSIEGNYRCYQKKYIQNFSIPDFTLEDVHYLKDETDTKAIDDFLVRKYCLQMP